MRWLEESRDDTERQVREALDAASSRNDDLALRRVWSRLAELMPGPRRGRVRWSFLVTVGGIGGAMLTAAWFLRPLLFEAPHRWPSTVAVGTSTVPPPPRPPVQARPAEPPQATPPAPVADGTPVVLGPSDVRTGARKGQVVRLKSGARVSLRSRSFLHVDAGQRPFLFRGRAGLEVPKQPQGESFSVVAGPYVVVVVGTKFGLTISPRTVKVDVREGVVQVWRGEHMIQLNAGDSWKGPARIGGARPARRLRVARASSELAHKLNAPDEHPQDRYQEAHAALDRGDSAAGLSDLRKAAEGIGPAAENAGLELGKILRDHMYQPRQAIVAWSHYRERFPDGLLRHEADVSIIETLLMLGDRDAARTEIDMFLRRHPHSERFAEMKQMLGKLDAERTTAKENDSRTEGPSAPRSR